MDLLLKTRAVKLKSHLEKYLVGDDDGESVRQSRNGSTRKAVWLIEACINKPDVIRMKSLSTGLYLTASDTPLLLGTTGNQVVQLSIFDPTRVEWEPVNDGFQVKFRSCKEGTYMRANGGSPPWRNSVSHDLPLTGRTYNRILWEVEPVVLTDLRSLTDESSHSSGLDSEDSYSSVSPMPSVASDLSLELSRKRSGIDFFHNAKAVRLRSLHDKYLIAEDDEDSVSQNRNGSSRPARWIVEFLETGTAIRLKSCYGKYLTASNNPFLLGMTGREVVQSRLSSVNTSMEWEPVKDGSQVRLRTWFGTYLRANGGMPPWRNSVTHDVPHRTATKDWVLWDVDIVEIVDSDKMKKSELDVLRIRHLESLSSSSSLMSIGSDRLIRQESCDSNNSSMPKSSGSHIYYHVADEHGEVNEDLRGKSFTFKGSLAELTLKLMEETGLEDIILCTRSPLNGKLYPLRLQLPPNNAMMHIIVVPSRSQLTEEFSSLGISS